MIGKTFGEWTVRDTANKRGKNSYWLCQCTCGVEREVFVGTLRAGRSKSCGHARGGLSKPIIPFSDRRSMPEYTSWRAMRKRCNSKRDKNYHNYGARGVSVCERWDNFDNFYADMGKRPEGRSLDRIDSSGDYTPENCRWATVWEQAQNTRANCPVIRSDGVRFPTINQAARSVGVLRTTLRYNINKNHECGGYQWEIENKAGPAA